MIKLLDHTQEACQSLSLVTRKKLDRTISKIKNNCSCDYGCIKCKALEEAITRYFYANIPADYWLLDMMKFSGAQILKDKYELITKDIDNTYDKGLAINFAGKFGLGKSMSSICILKRALEKGYSGFYTTLDSIVSYLTSSNTDKTDVKNALQSIDFLIIDEFDPRFMGTANAADLFGRIFEPIFRNRVQNNYPLILCTNSPNVAASFDGPLKESISSLMNFVETVPVIGKDFRKQLGNKS